MSGKDRNLILPASPLVTECLDEYSTSPTSLSQDYELLQDWSIRPDDIPFPKFSQKGYVCVPASALLALYFWDLMDNDAIRILSVLTNINEDHLNQVEARMETSYPRYRDQIREVEFKVRKNGVQSFNQNDYEIVSFVIYYLHDSGPPDGLSSLEGEKSVRFMGLNYEREIILSFQEFFTHNLIQKLKPRGIAQLIWKKEKSFGNHAFLIGRNESGLWFIYDQAEPYVRIKDSLDELIEQIQIDHSNGTYSIIIDGEPEVVGSGIVKFMDTWS